MNIVTRIKHFRIWASNINISEINKKIQEVNYNTRRLQNYKSYLIDRKKNIIDMNDRIKKKGF